MFVITIYRIIRGVVCCVKPTENSHLRRLIPSTLRSFEAHCLAAAVWIDCH